MQPRRSPLQSECGARVVDRIVIGSFEHAAIRKGHAPRNAADALGEPERAGRRFDPGGKAMQSRDSIGVERQMGRDSHRTDAVEISPGNHQKPKSTSKKSPSSSPSASFAEPAAAVNSPMPPAVSSD